MIEVLWHTKNGRIGKRKSIMTMNGYARIVFGPLPKRMVNGWRMMINHVRTFFVMNVRG